MYNIKDVTGQKLVEVQPGELLLNVLVRAGLMPPDSPCGGKGLCRKCLVKIRMEGDWQEVLACQTRVISDLEIDIARLGAQKQVCVSEGSGQRSQFNPAVCKVFIDKLPGKLTLCWEELCEQAGIPVQQAIPENIKVLRDLAEFARHSASFTAVIAGQEVLALEAGNTLTEMYGMAFDIGTTTVVGYLLDLSSGRRLATASTLNPQVQYGADVMTRITAAAENSAGLSRLRDCIIECVNQLILEAAQSAAVSKDAIYDLVFVGNPSMQHLFFGIQPAGIGLAPYQPILRSDMLYRAVDIGLTVNAAAQLYWLPGVSGFVGADTIGMLISQPIDDAEQVTIALDIGTNGEMVLAWKDELWACSTAAGPAFEGACMACGMRAQPGAIDKVIINGDGVQYRVIGNVLPRGICGSGIINAIAAMINAGLIDKSGRLLEPADTNPLRELVVKRAGRGAFLLVAADQTADGKEIVITQEDIRQLQLAKAAIVSGLKMMLKQAGIDVPAVTKVVFAGAFGLFLTSENVGTIGLLPESLCDKIVYVGNAAGFGAENALLSKQMRQVAGEIAKRVNYVELAGRPEFSDIFIGELYFSAVKAQ